MVRQHRSLTMFLLACALFLRVWVPAGWMPSTVGRAFTIEPCAGADAMPMDHAGGAHHDPSHKSQHEGDCAFAPHHSAATETTAPPMPVAAVPAQSTIAEPVAASFFATGPPSPPPPARAPPALA